MKLIMRTKSPLWACYKPVIILMLLAVIPPLAGFILSIAIIIYFPGLFFLALALILLCPVYIAILLYWFFKKSNLYKEWKKAVLEYGIKQAMETMEDIPPEKLRELAEKQQELLAKAETEAKKKTEQDSNQ
ncbi:MAG: hypothetical protein QXK06_03540 [Candidatus Diapherotrites archaeon]